MERRVVITGMGIWSCLGNSLADVCHALYAGKSMGHRTKRFFQWSGKMGERF